MTWPRALREAAVAAVLVAVVAFVGGNFVLVDVRLPGWTLQTRLAWVVVVPGALAFVAGVLYARSWDRIEPVPAAPQEPARSASPSSPSPLPAASPASPPTTASAARSPARRPDRMSD